MPKLDHKFNRFVKNSWVNFTSRYGTTVLHPQFIVKNNSQFAIKLAKKQGIGMVGSRGSVVPHFKKLIQEGKPLTITDSRMTRFILTLQKSVELVLTAMTEGVGGEVFVRKMPGHSIADLAEVLLEANGKNSKNIINMGIRPGEKIHETLISPAESVRTVEFGDYYVILPQISIPAVEKKYAGLRRQKEFRYASDTTTQIGKKELRSLLEKEGWIKK